MWPVKEKEINNCSLQESVITVLLLTSIPLENIGQQFLLAKFKRGKNSKMTIFRFSHLFTFSTNNYLKFVILFLIINHNTLVINDPLGQHAFSDGSDFDFEKLA